MVFSCKSRCLYWLIGLLNRYQHSKIIFKSLVWNLEWNCTFIQFEMWKPKCKHRLLATFSQLTLQTERWQLLILVQHKFLNIWRPHKGHRGLICLKDIKIRHSHESLWICKANFIQNTSIFWRMSKRSTRNLMFRIMFKLQHISYILMRKQAFQRHLLGGQN